MVGPRRSFLARSSSPSPPRRRWSRGGDLARWRAARAPPPAQGSTQARSSSLGGTAAAPCLAQIELGAGWHLLASSSFLWHARGRRMAAASLLLPADGAEEPSVHGPHATSGFPVRRGERWISSHSARTEAWRSACRSPVLEKTGEK
jgi:hypothetical protein